MELKYVAVVAVALVACVTDLRSRRIPNVLTFGAAAAGLVFHIFAPMGEGPTTALLRWLIGVAIFFVPFALGGLGGARSCSEPWRVAGAVRDFLGGAVYGRGRRDGNHHRACQRMSSPGAVERYRCWRIGALPGFARCRS